MARPVVLNPVITPITKKTHTTTPPIRGFHPAATFSPLRLATTPPLNRILSRDSPIADQPNLRFEPDAALLLDLVARHFDQRAHFGRLRAAQIHDKVRVLLRKRSAAQARALQSGAFEQAPAKFPGGFLKIDPAFGTLRGWRAARFA